MSSIRIDACTACGLSTPLDAEKSWTICVSCFESQPIERKQFIESRWASWRAASSADRALTAGAIVSMLAMPHVFPLFNVGVTWTLELGLSALFGTFLAILLVFRVRRQRQFTATFRELARRLRCIAFLPERLWGYPQVTGYRDGLPVTVSYFERRTGKNSQRYLRIDVLKEFPAGLHLSIQQATAMALVESWLGFLDIELNDPAFDEAFRVTADDEAAARMFLSSYRCKIFLELSLHHRGFVSIVDDKGLLFHVPSSRTDANAAQLESDVKALCGICRGVPIVEVQRA